MKFRKMLQWILGLAVVCVIAWTPQAQGAVSVVTGTSLVGEMVQQMIGSPESLHNLLPPNMCPGHYDIRPGDLEAVRSCQMLLLQPWQRKMPNVESVIRSSNIADPRVKVVPVSGNWMLPTMRCEAVRGVSTILSAEFPEKKTTIEAATKRMVADSERVGDWGRAQFQALSPGTLPVLCNEQQGDFVRWLGFSDVQVFGRPEGMSVAQIEALTVQVKKTKTALVIDNLQSGDTKMGETLARNAGAIHVVLSNFPGAEKGCETWEQTFKTNVERILAAVRQWQSVPHE